MNDLSAIISVSMRDLVGGTNEVNNTCLQTTCRRVPIHKTFSRRKLTTCAWPVIETFQQSLTGKEFFLPFEREVVCFF